MTDRSETRVKIVFRFTKDPDGWPPVDAESVWATDLGEGRYRLDNSPFFARGVAWKDIVIVGQDEGTLVFQKVERHSGHSTIRVYCQDEAKRNALADRLAGLGCSYEGIPQYKIVAIDVPPTVDIKPIQAILDKGEEQDEWGYEEGLLAGPNQPG